MQPKGDHLKICRALRKAVMKRGVQDFARKSKIGSTTIYQATNPDYGNPSLTTLVRIVKGLGYELVVRARPGRFAPPDVKPGTVKVLIPSEIAQA